MVKSRKNLIHYLNYVCYTVDISILNKHDFIDDVTNPLDAIIGIDTNLKYDPLVELRKIDIDIMSHNIIVRIMLNCLYGSIS